MTASEEDTPSASGAKPDATETGHPAHSTVDSALTLSAVILTFNEARHIVDCIDSLRWADQIIVFDSFSEDGTVELAEEMGAIVSQSHFENYAQQRNAALDFVGDQRRDGWVFFVDADERGTDELGAEVRQVIGERREAGWYVPRQNYIFGRLTTGAGWYPDYQFRLLRLGRARYERPVHEIAVVDGRNGYLKNPLIHFNYDDSAHFHDKQRKYVEYDAAILKQQGIRPKAYTPYSQALRHFWWRFSMLKGARDGVHGLRLSLYLAYYEWLKYRRLADLWRAGKEESPGAKS